MRPILKTFKVAYSNEKYKHTLMIWTEKVKKEAHLISLTLCVKLKSIVWKPSWTSTKYGFINFHVSIRALEADGQIEDQMNRYGSVVHSIPLFLVETHTVVLSI